MIRRREKGFAVLEFLMTASAFFCAFYFVFWVSYLGSNYALSKHYLNDFSLCQLNLNSKDCWRGLTQRLNSLKFIKIKKLDFNSSFPTKTIALIYDFTLPIVGGPSGVKNIALTHSINLRDWQ